MKEQKSYVFKKVVIRDPQSTWHNQKVDIQVEEGSITQIAPELSGYDPSMEVPFNSESLSEVNVMPGWVDPHVEGGNVGRAAEEHRATPKRVRRPHCEFGHARAAAEDHRAPPDVHRRVARFDE